MGKLNTTSRVAMLAMAVAIAATPVFAETRHRERPLTITRHTGTAARGTGIETRDGGREIVAWGGFSANGYGPNRMGREASRRELRNESVRLRTEGVYGYGFDGLGGTANGGYNNPNYGNAYSSYVGYNGVPTNLAFGPGFASRHITDSDDFDNDADLPGPTPGELGYNPFD